MFYIFSKLIISNKNRNISIYLLLLAFSILFSQFISVKGAESATGIIEIQIIDDKDKPLSGASISIVRNSDNNKSSLIQKNTNQKGETSFPGLHSGLYKIEINAKGYETFSEDGINVQADSVTKLAIQLTPKVTISEDTIVVSGSSTNPVEQTSAPQAQLTAQVIRTAPLMSRTFDAAIPNIPNVIRTPDGKINIKGGREDQSALLINEADSTDPATGNFALSIPLESIEQVKVFTNPYLPEYGKFTGGVTKVETKRGGEKWKAEVYDFFPEPRIRNGKLFGFANFSPRFHMEGPIIKNRFYISQGLEYDVDKKPVRGLPSPNNEMIKKVARSFTQFDYIASPNQTLTATVSFSSGNFKHIGLDFFNPQPVSPNRETKDLTIGFIDRLTLNNNSLIETLFQYKRLDVETQGKGLTTMVLTPNERSGNYFHRESRTTERFEARATDSLSPIVAKGVHQIKIGTDFSYSINNGINKNQPINILRGDGTKAQTIEYLNTGELTARNAEVAAFAQDQWLIRSNLNMDFGIRAELMRATAGINVSPRIAVSYSPTKSTVLRVGAGIFYDKVSLNALAFTKSPKQQITTYSSDGQTIIGKPILFENLLSTRPNGDPNTGFDFAAPRNITLSAQIDQKIKENITLKIAYIDSQTDQDFYISPTETNGKKAITLFNNGHARYRSLETTANLKLFKNQELTISYIKSQTKGELNNFGKFYGDFPDPIIRPNQYSSLLSDVPHRFLLQGNLKLPYGLTIAPLLDTHTGFPYSIQNANQDFIGKRNQARFPHFTSLDLAVTKDVKLNEKYTAQITVSIFNATNHFNPRNVFSNIDSQQFGTFFASYRRFYRLDLGFNW